MESKVSEILENILSMLGLEGSFEVEEREDSVFVTIELTDPGKLIGHQGETLSALQLIINQIVAKQLGITDKTDNGYKRVIIDIAGWKQGKEEELAYKARGWARQVKENGKSMELPPMPAWQRRIVHMTIQGTEGVCSESVGEGADRHLVIRLDDSNDKE